MPRLPVKKLRKQLKLLLLLVLLTFAVWFTYLHISLVRQGRALRLPFAYGRGKRGGGRGGRPSPPLREWSAPGGTLRLPSPSSVKTWWGLGVFPPPERVVGAPHHAGLPEHPPGTAGLGAPPALLSPSTHRGETPRPCGAFPSRIARVGLGRAVPRRRSSGERGDQRRAGRDPRPAEGFSSPPSPPPRAAPSSFFRPPLWLR